MLGLRSLTQLGTENACMSPELGFSKTLGEGSIDLGGEGDAGEKGQFTKRANHVTPLLMPIKLRFSGV